MGQIRSVVARLDPNLPAPDLRTLPQQIATTRSSIDSSGSFAASFAPGHALAAIGLYGVLAYSFAADEELGLRMA